MLGCTEGKHYRLSEKRNTFIPIACPVRTPLLRLARTLLIAG
jgi:hypothetical protein